MNEIASKLLFELRNRLQTVLILYLHYLNHLQDFVLILHFFEVNAVTNILCGFASYYFFAYL